MKKLIFAAFLFSTLVFAYISCSYNFNYDYSELLAQYENLEVQNSGKDVIITPKNVEIQDCIIFYPGAKVDSKAYLPLLMECSQKTNAKCVLIHMPLDYAFNNKGAAKQYRDEYSSTIKNFYIAGHSLGGAMAGSFIAGQENNYAGLILLAAFSTEQIPEGVKVLSIYGSEDGVLNRDSYEKYKSNLPENFKEYVIKGGNHGNFGNYGHQKNDGEATITNIEQQKITAGEIAEFLKS